MKSFILSGIFSTCTLLCFSQTAFQKIYGTVQDEQASGIQQTSDGGYMIAGAADRTGTGYFTDILLVKTDVNGDTLWTRFYDTNPPAITCTDAHQTSDGGYILTGSSSPAGVSSAFVVKTDASGNLAWSNNYVIIGDTWANDIEQTSDGGYIISGETDSSGFVLYPFLLKVDQNGNMQWSRTYKIPGYDYDMNTSVKELSLGGYVISCTCFSNFGFEDAGIIKTGVSGNVIWAKTFDTGQYNFAGNIIETTNGDFLFLGRGQDNIGIDRMQVTRISTSGSLIWAKKYIVPNNVPGPAAVKEAANGDFFISGGYNYMGFLSSITSTGTVKWANVYGTQSLYCIFNRCALTSDGGTVNGGSIPAIFTASDTGSFYLVKTDINGNSGCNQMPVALTDSVLPVTITPIVVNAVAGGVWHNINTTVHSGLLVVDPCVTGINNPEKNEITTTIFPNPFSEKTTIEISGAISNEKSHFELFDINGNSVREFYFTGNTVELERKNLSSGIYFYRIISENKIIATGKMIAE